MLSGSPRTPTARYRPRGAPPLRHAPAASRKPSRQTAGDGERRQGRAAERGSASIWSPAYRHRRFGQNREGARGAGASCWAAAQTSHALPQGPGGGRAARWLWRPGAYYMPAPRSTTQAFFRLRPCPPRTCQPGGDLDAAFDAVGRKLCRRTLAVVAEDLERGKTRLVADADLRAGQPGYAGALVWLFAGDRTESDRGSSALAARASRR